MSTDQPELPGLGDHRRSVFDDPESTDVLEGQMSFDQLDDDFDPTAGESHDGVDDVGDALVAPDPDDTTGDVGPGWKRVGQVVGALVVLGLLARLADLGGRPLHHDEGLDAWFSWRYLEGTYDGYDPVYHGPLRFYITAGFYWLFGESDTVARLLAALSGAVVVALPWFWRRDLGRIGTPIAIGLIAISPSMLYFSRVGREDSFFLAITFGAVLVLIALLRNPRTWHPTALLCLLVAGWAVKESIFLTIFVFGGFGMILLIQAFALSSPAGEHASSGSRRLGDANVQRITLVGGLVLMIATLWWIGLDPQQIDPETGEEIGGNPTFLKLGLYGAFLGAMIIVAWIDAHRRGVRAVDVPLVANIGRPGAFAWLTAIVSSVALFVVLFTQFLTDWDGAGQIAPTSGEDTRSAPYGSIKNGLLAGLEYWLGEQDTVRGDSRWQYYLAVIPAYEWFILILSIIGIVLVVRRPTLVGQTLVWWGVASLVLHSWAGERMPWLIIHPLLPFVLLAGLGGQFVWHHRPQGAKVVALAVPVALGLTWTLVTTYQASYLRGGEPQELFVQAGQASPEVPEWTDRLERLDDLAMAELGRHLTVSIDGDVYWPYGWYLRDFPTGTYADLNDASEPPGTDVIFLPHWDQGGLGSRLEGYVALPYEHRWWWVPDFDADIGQWAAWLWDRDPWQRDQSRTVGDEIISLDGSDCPGSVVGQVYIREEIWWLEQNYYGGELPEVAATPDYEGPCRRPEHLAPTQPEGALSTD